MTFLPVLCAPLLVMLAACEASIGADAVALSAPVALAAPAVQRCRHCGWIESKREIQPRAADPNALIAYEYIDRMANGSSSVFQETLPASWRLGERLILIGGAGALD